MQSSGSPKIRGWIFDIYPSNIGEMAVWIIAEDGNRIRLTDRFQPKIYVSCKKEDVEKLVGRIYSNPDIANYCFVYKFAQPTDSEKSRVLEITQLISFLDSAIICDLRFITAICTGIECTFSLMTYFRLPS